jgi:hypothetical protein
VRKFKDSTGNYLWQPPAAVNGKSSLIGFPLVDTEDMPDVAANSLSIAFGDFRRGYLIVDRAGVRDFDAIKLLKFAVSWAALVPRTQRSASPLRGVVRCRAGAQLFSSATGVPALRSGMKNAAPRPGHGVVQSGIQFQCLLPTPPGCAIIGSAGCATTRICGPAPTRRASFHPARTRRISIQRSPRGYTVRTAFPVNQRPGGR